MFCFMPKAILFILLRFVLFPIRSLNTTYPVFLAKENVLLVITLRYTEN